MCCPQTPPVTGLGQGWGAAGAGRRLLLAAKTSVCPEHGRQALRDEQSKYVLVHTGPSVCTESQKRRT